MADIPMRLKPSTQVRAATYDPQAQRLTLTLNSGGKYAYHQVPQDKAVAFGEADSHGDFFHANIRGKHEYTRVS